MATLQIRDLTDPLQQACGSAFPPTGSLGC
jgi:hypothetical protein